jgi:hypothetical protein
MAVGQLEIYWLTHPHRGQAPSHILISTFQVHFTLLLICSAFDFDLKRSVLPVFGHTEPGRGAEWWGKSLFGFF